MRFENIYKETEENMRLALLSLWAPGNHPMRSAINELLDRESLLAEPVFQSTDFSLRLIFTVNRFGGDDCRALCQSRQNSVGINGYGLRCAACPLNGSVACICRQNLCKKSLAFACGKNCRSFRNAYALGINRFVGYEF